MQRIRRLPRPLIFWSALGALLTSMSWLGWQFLPRLVSWWFGGQEDLGADLWLFGTFTLGTSVVVWLISMMRLARGEAPQRPSRWDTPAAFLLLAIGFGAFLGTSGALLRPGIPEASLAAAHWGEGLLITAWVFAFGYGSVALDKWMRRLAHKEAATPGPGAQP